MATEFIKDVIYGLKIEYGVPAIFTNRTSVTNLITGMDANTDDSFTIPKVIPIPRTDRQAFLKSVGIHIEGYLEQDEEEILIARSDIPSGKSIKVNTIVTRNSIRQDVIRIIEKFPEAMIVITKILP